MIGAKRKKGKILNRLIRTPSPQHAQRSLGKILEGKGGNVDFIFSLFGFHKDKEAERLY